jgi:ferredoxin--NADP+ reductase
MVGAGPAALYCSGKLVEAGHTVLILNRDIKPGGLAEYGIYPTKHKMKEGLRNQFRRILAHPRLLYFGNVAVREDGAVRWRDLTALTPSAIIVAAGAQGTKSLGLPGEEGPSVYHAKDLVYHYNRLPPFTEREFPLGDRVAIIGIGNVMVDIAHYLVAVKRVGEVIAVARRGPGERAYDDREMEAIAASIDRQELRAELERIRPRLEQVGQDVEALYRELTNDCDVPPEDGPSPTRLTFRFLASPTRIARDARGRVVRLEVEENALVEREGKLAAKGLGQTSLLQVDTVIFAIGDRVDPTLGLPVKNGGYATGSTAGREDAEAAQYQVVHPGNGQPVEGAFVVGWSRSASEGVVGKARRDGEKGAAVANRFLAHRPSLARREIYQRRVGPLYRRLREQGVPVVHKGLWRILEKVEREEARRRGLPEFKFGRNEEMLEVLESTVRRLAGRSAREAAGRPHRPVLLAAGGGLKGIERA